jgi:hypothetical protein
MYLDVKVEEAFRVEFANERSLLVGGDVPSEPGGVEARSIPLAPGTGRKKSKSILWRLRAKAPGEMARYRAAGQSLPGLAEARVARGPVRTGWDGRDARPHTG